MPPSLIETSTTARGSAKICRMAFRRRHIARQCAGNRITAESDLPHAEEICRPVSLLVLLGLQTAGTVWGVVTPPQDGTSSGSTNAVVAQFATAVAPALSPEPINEKPEEPPAPVEHKMADVATFPSPSPVASKPQPPKPAEAPKSQRVVITPDGLLAALQGKLDQAAEKAAEAAVAKKLDEAAEKAAEAAVAKRLDETAEKAAQAAVAKRGVEAAEKAAQETGAERA